MGLLEKIKAFVWDLTPPVTHVTSHLVRNVEDNTFAFSDATPRYPVYDYGFPSSSPENLLKQHTRILERLTREANHDGRFTVSPVELLVKNYAAYVNCLPATYKSNHHGAGGLLKLGIDVAFFSLQAANGMIFSNESADRRTLAEPRWRLATFLAGLTCELSRTIPTIIVTNSNGDQWNPFGGNLSQWLAETNSSRFWVVRRKPPEVDDQKSLVSFILPKILTDDVLIYLSEDLDVLIKMHETITGTVCSSDKNPIQQLVGKIRCKVIAADIANNMQYVVQ